MRRDADANTDEWRRRAPGGAGYGTARAMAALYQMMLAGGELNGTRIVSPRTLQYAIRNHTADRVDEFMGMPGSRPGAPFCAAPRPTSAGSAPSPTRASSAKVRASARRTAGAIRTRACRSPTSPTTAFPDPWHSKRLISSPTSCTRPSRRSLGATAAAGARARSSRRRGWCWLPRRRADLRPPITMPRALCGPAPCRAQVL